MEQQPTEDIRVRAMKYYKEPLLFEREYSSKQNVLKSFKVDFENDFFSQKDIREHTGCVNALQFSHREHLLATGGDDHHARVWKIDELMLRKDPKPVAHAVKAHKSNIFSLAFDLEDQFIYSGERWGYIYKHDITTSQTVYEADDNHSRGDVHELQHHPTDQNLILATHCKLISFIDDRDYSNPTEFKPSHERKGDYNSAEFNPENPVLVLVTTERGGPEVYDIRNPTRPVFLRDKFVGMPAMRHIGWMTAKWSPSGNQFMAIRKLSNPLYFDLISQRCIGLNHQFSRLRYRNGKTMKSMAFIDDHTVATGSDHWGIHFWRAPRATEEVHNIREEFPNRPEYVVKKEIRILRGHRSIPNKIVFSKQNQLLVSSGVEKSFKLWSNRRLPWSYDVPFERKKCDGYMHSQEEEILRERRERLSVEDEMESADEMEGRSTWNDVFGGNADTAEDRDTLEMFDVPNYDGFLSEEDSDREGDREELHFNNRWNGRADLMEMLLELGEHEVHRLRNNEVVRDLGAVRGVPAMFLARGRHLQVIDSSSSEDEEENNDDPFMVGVSSDEDGEDGDDENDDEDEEEDGGDENEEEEEDEDDEMVVEEEGVEEEGEENDETGDAFSDGELPDN